MATRWVLFLGKVVLVSALALLIIFLPLPVLLSAGVSTLRLPIVVIVAVCFIGKLFYDTLFYDHYQP